MTFRKLFVFSAFSFACGSSAPTNFAGTYTLTTTENANDCSLPNWTQGSSTTFTATFTQDGTNAQITVQGAAALFLDVYVGTPTFQGTVSGDTFTTEYIGTKTGTQGTCSFTVNIGISASLNSNNVISGTITLTPVTNHDAACGAMNTCVDNTETVSGNRTSP